MNLTITRDQVHPFLILALALGPVCFWLLYFYLRDRYEPEPLRWILKVFLLGILVVLPVAMVETAAAAVAGNFLVITIIAPVVEEVGKFAVVYLTVYRTNEFSEPLDGIIYAVTAALGFASLENVGYIWEAAQISPTMGITIAGLRAILSVPGHAIFSSMWGYSLGIAKFRQNIDRNGIILAGLATAILLHALFNFLAFEVLGFVILVFLLVPLLWWLVGKAVRDAEIRR